MSLGLERTFPTILLPAFPIERAEKHQAGPGGYLDQIGSCFRLAAGFYSALSNELQDLFHFASAVVVLYFHDIEKPWKYGIGSPGPIDKEEFLRTDLPTRYGITFSPDEWNALTYVHGEPESEYNPNIRLMGRLASVCHAADCLSARGCHDQGRGIG